MSCCLRVKSREWRSGRDVDAEHGRGDGAQEVCVEGLGFVEVEETGHGHLGSLAAVLARQAAEFLGEGVVTDELLAG